MAIPVQRFKLEDKDTNVPVVDFIKIKSTDILNSISSGLDFLGGITNEIKAITGKASEFVDSIETAIDDVKSTVEGIINSGTSLINDTIDSVVSPITDGINRIAEDGMSSVNLLLNQKDAFISKAITPIFDGMSEVESIIKQLNNDTSSRITNIVSNLSTAKTDVSIKVSELSTIKNKVSASVSDIKKISESMKKITPALDIKINNYSSIEKSIIALTTISSDVKMHGVFTSLCNSYMADKENEKAVLNSANYLVNYASKNNDITLLKEIANSSIGALLCKINPNTMSVYIKGFSIDKITNKELLNEFNSFMDNLENMYSGWNKNNNKLTLVNILNPDIKKGLTFFMKSLDLNIDDPFNYDIKIKDKLNLAIAFQSNINSPDKQLNKDFSFLRLTSV